MSTIPHLPTVRIPQSIDNFVHLAAVINRVGPVVMNFARSRGISASDADDLVSDVHVRYVEMSKIHGGKIPFDPSRANLDSLIWQNANWAWRKILRKRGTRKRHESECGKQRPEHYTSDLSGEFWEHVEHALAHLSNRQREIIYWKFRNECSVSEIAQTIGVSKRLGQLELAEIKQLLSDVRVRRHCSVLLDMSSPS